LKLNENKKRRATITPDKMIGRDDDNDKNEGNGGNGGSGSTAAAALLAR
jgi:hypothetical protein